MQRILFHPAPTVEWLKGLKVETLGKSSKGTWMAVDDATALELLKRDKSTMAMYPTRLDYEEAVKGLTEPEIAEAVGLRLALVQANIQNETLPNFSERALSILSAMAVSSVPTDTTGNAMRAAYFRQLELVRSLAGKEEGGGSWPASLIGDAFDPMNRLNWEEEILRKHVGEGLFPREKALETSRQELGRQIRLAEGRHGVRHEQPTTGRVLDRLERGIFAKPFDEKLVRAIDEGHEPVLKWKDGFVCIWSELQFNNIPMDSKEKAILYYNADELRGAFMSLTRGQVRERLSKQSKVSRKDDANFYLANLKLSVIIDLRSRLKAIAKLEKELAGQMARHADAEAESLRNLLATHRIWRSMPVSGPEGIRAEMDGLAAEAGYWNSWAALNHWTLIQPVLEENVALLNSQTKP